MDKLISHFRIIMIGTDAEAKSRTKVVLTYVVKSYTVTQAAIVLVQFHVLHVVKVIIHLDLDSVFGGGRRVARGRARAGRGHVRFLK